ncbi:MAG: DUF47 family protein [Candidatus Bathyarchaeia archaeon]
MGFKIAAIFRRPTEPGVKESFFNLFAAQASTISEAAHSLREMAETLESRRQSGEEKAARMKTLEEKGDDICRAIYKKLEKTFITPASLDEEDIRSLTASLDDVLDMLEKASSRLVVFGVERPPPKLKQLATLLQKMMETLETLIMEFGKKLTGSLGEMCAQIHRLEEEMDRSYRGALTELFSPSSSVSVRELIAWKEIYEIMESAADCCHDAVVVVEGILSKNRII